MRIRKIRVQVMMYVMPCKQRDTTLEFTHSTALHCTALH
jgi:hypothetical protein